MAAALGIASSVIAIAELAWSSAKVLHETISSIKDAPKTFGHLNEDVQTLSDTIYSLQQKLEEDKNAHLSEAHETHLSNVKPTLEACRTACDAFRAKIDKMLRHSKPGEVGWQDRVKLQFKEKDIAVFQARLGSYKGTLGIALEFSTFKTASDNLDATKALETKIEEVTAGLAGQMQGLQIGLQAITDAQADNEIAESQRQLVETQQSQILRAIEQQSAALSHCYGACLAALKETTQATGHRYKYIKASEQARLIAGNVGGVQGDSHEYGQLEVNGGWVVAGNVSADAVKDIFK